MTFCVPETQLCGLTSSGFLPADFHLVLACPKPKMAGGRRKRSGCFSFSPSLLQRSLGPPSHPPVPGAAAPARGPPPHPVQGSTSPPDSPITPFPLLVPKGANGFQLLVVSECLGIPVWFLPPVSISARVVCIEVCSSASPGVKVISWHLTDTREGINSWPSGDDNPFLHCLKEKRRSWDRHSTHYLWGMFSVLVSFSPFPTPPL